MPEATIAPKKKSRVPLTDTQRILRVLAKKGMRPLDIARKTGDLVTERTVYRWRRGECEPKNIEHHRMLRRLVLKITKDPNFILTAEILAPEVSTPEVSAPEVSAPEIMAPEILTPEVV
tara:strand:- start:3452 stop:3808 length:357 start_codon:yes stop_codon:yes gene_type:complete